jgi:hypothetical protein
VDPLSYTDAIVSAITDLGKRAAVFALVFAASAFLGWNIHNAPINFASLASIGLPEVTAYYKSIDAKLIVGWIGTVFPSSDSLWLMWLNPIIYLYFLLFTQLCRGGEMFWPLMVLAVVHSIHAFVFMQFMTPLRGTTFAVAVALLIICELFTAGLLLWWRHLRNNTPLPFP